MKKLYKYLVIVILTIGFIVTGWWINSLVVARNEFYTGTLNLRGTPLKVATAFTMALWLNDDTAYELSDPALWIKIDEWMKTHPVRSCSVFDPGQIDSVGGSVNPDGAYYSFSCDAGALSLDNVQLKQDSSGDWYIIHWELAQ